MAAVELPPRKKLPKFQLLDSHNEEPSSNFIALNPLQVVAVSPRPGEATGCTIEMTHGKFHIAQSVDAVAEELGIWIAAHG